MLVFDESIAPDVQKNQAASENPDLAKLTLPEKIERSADLIKSAYDFYGSRFAIAHSCGKDSIALWHIAQSVDAKIRGFVITTPFKHPETKRYTDFLLGAYPMMELFYHKGDVPQGLPEADRKLCCQMFKVDVLQRAIHEMGLDCWASGIRRDEGIQRKNILEFYDDMNGVAKLNPMAYWTELEIWQYIALMGIPVNRLYLKGYRSVGCSPCTDIVPGGAEREGRWTGTSRQGGECGFHVEACETCTKARDGE